MMGGGKAAMESPTVPTLVMRWQTSCIFRHAQGKPAARVALGAVNTLRRKRHSLQQLAVQPRAAGNTVHVAPGEMGRSAPHQSDQDFMIPPPPTITHHHHLHASAHLSG
jgi:hypothetical protein